MAIIGLDDHDGVLLLDLEQLGVLNVLGDEHIANGMLNALAGELAGNPWGEQIQVTLVGMPLTLARNIDRFRIQHVDEVATLLRDLQIDLDERAAALSSYGVDDVHAARTLAAVTESWAPHIVLLAKTPEEPQRRELAELVDAARRLGIAVIASGQIDASCAIIQLGSSGRAELILPGGAMPPLPFTPQLLYGRELERLEHLFKTTENDPTRPAPIERAPIERERAVAQPCEASTLTMLPELDPVPVAVALPDGFASPDRWRQSEAERNDIFDLQSEKNNSAESPTPYIRFLGPVEAVGLNPREPMPGRGVELIAFLLLRNGPVDGLQLQRAFWPDTPDAANNQRGLAKKVCSAFGRTGTGELLLPENVNHHGYLLHPSVRSDWDDFRALVGDNPTLTGTDNLIAALRLVRGTPFAGCNTRRWWQWIAIPQEEMIAAIMDASDELGNRALEERNAPLARYAARIEQAVDPLNEAGWRIELRAALQTGKTDDFHTVLNDLFTRVGGHDPDYEVDANTQTLIDHAHQRVHT